MRRLPILLLVVIPMVVAARSQKSATPPSQNATEPQAQTPEPSELPKGQVLVAQLPAGARARERSALGATTYTDGLRTAPHVTPSADRLPARDGGFIVCRRERSEPGRPEIDARRVMIWRHPSIYKEYPMDFQSRAVMSLVELHERELRSFLEVWDRFLAAGAPMPEARGDKSYESRDTLGAHVLMAARGYLIRIGEWVGRPVSDMDGSQGPARHRGPHDGSSPTVCSPRIGGT